MVQNLPNAIETFDTLCACPEAFGEARDVQVLLGLMERWTELQLRAEPLGRRVYADKPARFTKRLRRDAKAWQIETKRTPVLGEQG